MKSCDAVIWVSGKIQCLEKIISLLDSVGYSYQFIDSINELLFDSKLARYGCFITDVELPNLDSFALLNTIQKRALPIKVIFITANESVQIAVDMLKAGAFDYFPYPFEEQLILDSINLAKRSSKVLYQKTQQQVDCQRRLEKLTPREKEVMLLICEDTTNKGIADQLGISLSTVELHRAKVMKKMQVKSIAQLVRLFCSVD